MFRASHYFVIGAVTMLFLACSPYTAFSAELTFKVLPNTGSENNFRLIEVRIDPQAKKLNVVEGTLAFSGTASENLAVHVENGQSILPIWPVPPEYDTDIKAIDFTGGVPNGFDTEGLLFTLRVIPTVSGDVRISYEGGAYLNDGQGTKEVVSSQSIEISVDASEYNAQNKKISDFAKDNYAIVILLCVVVLALIFTYVFKKK